MVFIFTRKYTDEQLTVAVRESKDWYGVTKQLGLKSRDPRHIQKRSQKIGLDISHFNRFKYEYDDSEVMAALKKSTSVRQILRKLGIPNDGQPHYVRLGAILDRIEKNWRTILRQNAGANQSGYASADTDLRYNRKQIRDDNLFSETVKLCRSFAEVARAFSFTERSGSAISKVKQAVLRLNLSTEHFLSQGFLKGKSHEWNAKVPLENILKKGTKYKSQSLKKRLIRAGLKKDECELCGQGNEWCGKLLVLQLDHIDGDHFNNELSNLRVVCLHCHSQLPTFCSRNRKTSIIEITIPS